MQNTYNISFTGEFSYTLDAKGRLNIPAKFRKALHPVNDRTLVISRGFDGQLMVYPLVEWQKVENQLSKLSSIKRRDRTFVRSIVRYAEHVQMDTQGRIPVSDSLLSFAGIEKDVKIIGMIKKIELWSPDVLREVDSEFQDEDGRYFEELANDISF